MTAATRHTAARLTPGARKFYRASLIVLRDAGIEVLLGGAYALARFTGVERHTKDCDIFVRPEDFSRTCAALERAGFATEATYPHWLGKVSHRKYFIDVIYSSGNGIARVDDAWFERSVPDHVFDVPVRLCPAEEMLWVKAFIQERERFDGADVAHLLKACADRLDWQHLLRRFDTHWRVLLSHLVLFGFIYPNERDRIPRWIMRDLLRRLETSAIGPTRHEPLCQGTLLSRQQYLVDIENWGFIDARRLPDNPMSDDDIAVWTAGIHQDGSPGSQAST